MRVKLQFEVDVVRLMFGNLIVAASSTGFKHKGVHYYPFGWIEVYWRNKLILELGQERE